MSQAAEARSHGSGSRPLVETGRVIGRYTGLADGPTIVCIAGLHGNEPAGIHALRRVLAALEGRRPSFRGQLVGVAGNLTALRRGVRFVDRDLNRGWSLRQVRQARKAGVASAENREQAELVTVLEGILAGARGEVYLIDLHTTSAESAPFLTIGDTLHNRAFALRVGLPLVLGIEEQIDGALLEYFNRRGPVTLGIEGGRHEDPASVDHHERALWMVLMAAGSITEDQVPEAREIRRQLRSARGSLPGIFEVRFRRPVQNGDGFRMADGFRNFQPVRRGQAVASDRSGLITVPEDGRLFLPLYQDLGDDGFFIVRPVRRMWLRLSRLLRSLRVDALAHWLPGIRRSQNDPDTLLVNRLVARWLAVEVFHLLGFRKKRMAQGYLIVSRRSHRRPPPQSDSGRPGDDASGM